MITFQGYTEAAGRFGAGGGASSLSPSLPDNQSGDVMLAFINVTNVDFDGYPTVTPPAGWTLIIDNAATFGTNVLRAAYYKLGDGSAGTVTWAFNKPIRGNIDILCHREINTSTPIKDSSFKNNGSTSSPIANAVNTAGTPNCMLVCAWFEGGTCYHFTTNDFSEILVDIAGTTNSAERPTLIVDGIQAVAGSSGTKTATSYCLDSVHPSQAQAIMVALTPAPNPSVPTLIYPNGGEQLTAGATVNITWSPSTSPTAAQSTLKYNLDYSDNNGVSWTSIVALTSAGVTTYAWTVPATIGTGYLVRIRSNDPAAALFSLAYDESNSAFSVVTETTPGQPTITAPAVGSVHNKASNVTISWTHQGGAGNPQVAYTLQWANNAAFSSPTTVGPTTTTTQSTSIDFSGQASGTTIYVKVKTQGVSIYSAYSNITSFVVASVPATPNITAPVAASPPTTPLPTVTFTTADAFVSRKMRVTLSGTEVYNSGEVVSTALSFTSGYTFANGVAVVIFLSVKNQYGLWSAEDSETVTPSYAGPATPTLTITGVSESGYVLAQITNSDTPTDNQLWRYVATADISTAILVGDNIPVDGTFIDHHPISGVGYQYFARAYNAVLFTDSAASSTITLTMVNAFIHSVSRTNANSNAQGNAVSLLNTDGQWVQEEAATQVNLIGRDSPVVLLGQAQWQRINVMVVITNANITQHADLLIIWRTQKDEGIICFRDQKGNRLFGKMSQPQVTDESAYMMVSFEVIESAYVEGL